MKPPVQKKAEGEKKAEFRFFQIPTNPYDVTVTNKNVLDLLTILSNGGIIISSVGCAGSVQYILRYDQT